MKQITAVAIAASLFATAGLAQAGPEYTEEELFEMADIVVDVEVTANECLSAVETSESIVRRYGHTLQTLEVIKGDAGDVMELVGTSTEWDPEIGEAGCSQAEYVLNEGWVGRLYLGQLADGSLQIVDWGGAVMDQEASSLAPLPACEPKSKDIDPLPQPDEDPSDTSGVANDQAGGCSTSGSAPASGAWLALSLLGLGFAAARRRR